MVVPKILTPLRPKSYSWWGKYDTIITTNSSSGARAMLFSLPNPNTTESAESCRGESSAWSTSLWYLHETYVFGFLSGIWLKVEVLSLSYWETSILSIRLCPHPTRLTFSLCSSTASCSLIRFSLSMLNFCFSWATCSLWLLFWASIFCFLSFSFCVSRSCFISAACLLVRSSVSQEF